MWIPLEKLQRILLIVISTLLLTGCGVADGGKVTAKDVLKENPEADILQYNGFIYSNMTDVDWFKEQQDQYTKNDVLGEIKRQSTSSFGFKEWSATKLPIGTKIYSTKDSGILIVEFEGTDLYYMQLLEG